MIPGIKVLSWNRFTLSLSILSPDTNLRNVGQVKVRKAHAARSRWLVRLNVHRIGES